jgi:hypothetical protein
MFVKSETAFVGLESWENEDLRIFFISDTRDRGLRSFWRNAWPGLYKFLLDGRRQVTLSENGELVVKL